MISLEDIYSKLIYVGLAFFVLMVFMMIDIYLIHRGESGLLIAKDDF